MFPTVFKGGEVKMARQDNSKGEDQAQEESQKSQEQQDEQYFSEVYGYSENEETPKESTQNQELSEEEGRG